MRLPLPIVPQQKDILLHAEQHTGIEMTPEMCE
jgi:hypothetical protein